METNRIITFQTMTNKSNNSQNNRIFKVLSLLVPVFILLFIELGLRLFSYGDKMTLFIKHPDKELKAFYRVNPKVGEKYFTKFDATGGTNDVFLRKKNENSFRLFVMGSSTVVGFPYDKNLMFSRILHEQLQDAFPEKNIEVVNTAITAINTVTLRDYIDEIVKHKPDAILFYAGHNEFYGAFGIGSNETMSQNTFVRQMHFKLMHIRLYQLVRKVVQNTATNIANAKGNVERGSLMKRIVAEKEIIYGSELYKKGINQYKTNLSEILEIANKNDIPVFLSDLVSNIKDLHPFYPANENSNTQAINFYNKAKNAERGGNYHLASELYYKAKDHDPVRFRASEEINDIIDSLGKVNNCYLIEMKEAFINASENGLVGDNLLTEHVHPNIDGQFLMANTSFKAILESNIISDSKISIIKSIADYQNNWGYSDLDSLAALYRINQLKSYWPFTSTANTTTFRDTHIVTSFTDSLAFSVIQTNEANMAKLHNELGDYYFNNKLFSKALDEYMAITKINPHWPHYQNNLGKCYIELKDLYHAEICFKKSVQYYNTSYANLMLAEIEMIKYNLEPAIEYYLAAIESAEKTEAENAILGKLYQAYYLSKNDDKKEEVKKLLRKRRVKVPEKISQIKNSYSTYTPTNIEWYINRAKESYLNNNTDSALHYLNTSLRINDVPLIHKIIGDIMLSQKDSRLLKHYLIAEPYFDTDPSFLKNIGIAFYVNKQYDKVRLTIDKMTQHQASTADIEFLSGLIKNKK